MRWRLSSETYIYILSIHLFLFFHLSFFIIYLHHPYAHIINKQNLDSTKLLAKQCSLLQNIDISFCNKITDEAIEHLTALCPHLTEVNTRGCSVETISSSIKLMSSKSKDVKKIIDRNPFECPLTMDYTYDHENFKVINTCSQPMRAILHTFCSPPLTFPPSLPPKKHTFFYSNTHKHTRTYLLYINTYIHSSHKTRLFGSAERRLTSLLQVC